MYCYRYGSLTVKCRAVECMSMQMPVLQVSGTQAPHMETFVYTSKCIKDDQLCINGFREFLC